MVTWSLRACTPPLVRPVPVDPKGTVGPTKSQATGPYWRRSSPGLYVASSVDRTIVEQRILEQSLRLPRDGAVTGWAAARLHGVGYFDGLESDGRTEMPVPLCIPPGRNLRPGNGYTVFRERLDADEVADVHGVRVTTVARAVFDAARRARSLRDSVIAIDMSLAAGILPRSALASYLDLRLDWRGRPQVVRALDLADARCMSPKETVLRLIWCLDGGFPRPRSNWPVADANGRVIGRPDLLSTELAVVGEFDGSAHRTRSQHREDLRRDDRFRSVGLEPFRVVGSDLDDVALVLARIRQAIHRASVSGTPRTWMLQANPRPV